LHEATTVAKMTVNDRGDALRREIGWRLPWTRIDLDLFGYEKWSTIVRWWPPSTAGG
jgi:hypothetical protein